MIERFLLNEWDEMKKFYERSNKRNNLSKEMASNVQMTNLYKYDRYYRTSGAQADYYILSVIMTKD